MLNGAKILDRLEHSEPVHACFRIIGQHEASHRRYASWFGFCARKLAKLGDRFFLAAGAGRFSFIERFSPLARRRLLVAENLTIDLHGFVGLVLHREPPGLVEPIPLFGREDVQLLDRLNLGVARIDFAQTIEVRTFFVGLTVLFGAARQTCKSFCLIGVDEQNLAPVLNRQIACGLATRGSALSRAGCRLRLLSVTAQMRATAMPAPTADGNE